MAAVSCSHDWEPGIKIRLDLLLLVLLHMHFINPDVFSSVLIVLSEKVNVALS